MQNINVSNETYHKFMGYCKKTGQSSSVALENALRALKDLDKLKELEKVELLERRSKGKFVSIDESESVAEHHCIISAEVKKARAEPSTEWNIAREILETSLEADEEFEKSNPAISHKDLCNR
mgnify:CR=1 FL=1